MSYGWNHCYPNSCIPVTVTLQPPPFSMNIPSTSLCCPDQYACVDPCRPCSPVCAPSVCAPTVCGPAPRGSVPCGPAPCAPVSCGPVSCAPVVCGPGLSRSRYNSCYTSCSIPSRKCPDQYLCVDPCRPCSPTVCSPMVCSPTMCAPSVCAPRVCGPAPCGPASCAPVSCGPVSCGPVSCASMVCGPGLGRSRYSSCYSSCSLPSRKCLPRVQSICDPCTKY